MTTYWVIANSSSRTTDEAKIAETCDAIRAAGGIVARQVDLANEPMPPPGTAQMPDIVASLGGDGTASAVVDRYGTADGPRLLILPGGTMNLLAARLHGDDATPAEIIARAAQSGRTCRLPSVEGPDFRSLVGIIAGPASAWADVREDLRAGEIGALARDIPVALRETFAGPTLRLRGREQDHAALFVDAHTDGLHVHDIVAGSVGDLIRHGWAWLNRDFLGGPTEHIGKARQIIIESAEDEIMLLADGERHYAGAPLPLRWTDCPARLIATSDGC